MNRIRLGVLLALLSTPVSAELYSKTYSDPRITPPKTSLVDKAGKAINAPFDWTYNGFGWANRKLVDLENYIGGLFSGKR